MVRPVCSLDYGTHLPTYCYVLCTSAFFCYELLSQCLNSRLKCMVALDIWTMWVTRREQISNLIYWFWQSHCQTSSCLITKTKQCIFNNYPKVQFSEQLHGKQKQRHKSSQCSSTAHKADVNQPEMRVTLPWNAGGSCCRDEGSSAHRVWTVPDQLGNWLQRYALFQEFICFHLMYSNSTSWCILVTINCEVKPVCFLEFTESLSVLTNPLSIGLPGQQPTTNTNPTSPTFTPTLPGSSPWVVVSMFDFQSSIWYFHLWEKTLIVYPIQTFHNFVNFYQINP